MTLFMILWNIVSYDCPWGLGKATAIKPFVCTATFQKHWKLTSYQDEVKRLVEQAHDDGDQDPLVIVLTGARSRQAAVVWRPEIK